MGVHVVLQHLDEFTEQGKASTGEGPGEPHIVFGGEVDVCGVLSQDVRAPGCRAGVLQQGQQGAVQVQVLCHPAHHPQALPSFQGCCSSTQDDFSTSDGSFLPTPCIASPELEWLRVTLFTPPCFCEDPCLNLVNLWSKFYLLIQNFLLLEYKNISHCTDFTDSSLIPLLVQNTAAWAEFLRHCPHCGSNSL